ncbi:uncharacterized protein TrAtP1_012014 [Trichoderma atroviride]|uniref:uncharacterized protein n=1 Tax=Hypocrea atroviridis TaxID=63577 RepID=UPI00331D8FE7|nr:hypothetical protein TrAtP1_012014 [Trichoderma atroviride]
MTPPASSHNPIESRQVQSHHPPTARRNSCIYCPRSFKRAEHLQRHIRIHTKDKPYICHCGTAFARRDLLTRHERLSHDHVSPYQRVQASTNLQTPKSDTAAQPHADALNAVDISISNWTAPDSVKGTASQWPHHDHSSDALYQDLSNNALGTLSQAEGPIHLVAETATDQQFVQHMPQNEEDAFLGPEATLTFFNDDGSHFQEFARFLDGIGLPAEWTPPDIRHELDASEAEAEGHDTRVSNDAYSRNGESSPSSPFGSWPPSVPQGDQPLSSVSDKG